MGWDDDLAEERRKCLEDFEDFVERLKERLRYEYLNKQQTNADLKPGNGHTEEESPATTNRLDVGQTLEYGNGLVSNNNQWTLLFQDDGNLVLHNNGTPYWHTNTASNSSGTGSVNAWIKEDGNFVVGHEAGGVHCWESQSNGYGAVRPYILVQDDGNVCLYDEAVEGCHWAARNI
jgi:hypothetical protein